MVKHFSLGLLAGLLPLVVLAAPNDLKSLITDVVTKIINPVIGLMTALAVLYFVWGIVKYIQNAGDESKAKEGKSIMTYGILALFVLFSFWGIIQFIKADIFGS